MTAREIASRLTDSPKGITPKRTEKAKILAQRSKVEWADVEACLRALESRRPSEPLGVKILDA